MSDNTDKKSKQDGQADPADPEAALERHVDQLMDPSLPDPQESLDKSSTKSVSGAPSVPEIHLLDETKNSPADATPKAAPDKASAAAEKIPRDLTVESRAADPQTDEMVDDIVADEGDKLLEVQDAEIAKAFDSHTPSFWERLKTFFKTWWDNKPARYAGLAVLLIGLTIVGIIPGSRYFVLNTAGVRAKASLTILDGTTDLPLKNVDVTVGSQAAKTNEDGVARLHSLKLGPQNVTIEQLGFAKVTRSVTLGLGSNPLGEVELRAVGTQFNFKLTDYLTGKPVKNGEVSSGDANAQTNDKGEAVLTIGKIDSPKLDVVLKAGGYRSEKTTIDTTTKQVTSVVMVIKRKEVFVSKQSGKFDVYKVDVDGKNRQLLLAGTGLEREQITLVPHATDEMVALVSSRDTKRNQDGYLLDTLTLINVDNGSTLNLESSERIQIVDWIGDRLVYVKVKAGSSAANPERNQLLSYDYNTTTRLQLAGANSFSDIVSAKGAIYYASASGYQANQGGQAQFAKINPDNTGKQTLQNAEVWDIMRTSYDDLYLAGSYTGNTQNWYSYRLGDQSAKKMSQQPANTNETRFYLDAPDRKHALWTDTRDGKGVLLAYDGITKKDKVLATQSGLTYPLRWLDSRTAIYRVATPGETASYVVSLDGGTPRKVVDVTNVTGLGKWHYGYY